MTPVTFLDRRVTLWAGDCLAVLADIPEASVDSVVTDPPYHLTTGKPGGSGVASDNPNSPAGRSRIGTGFMGKAWDGGDIAFDPATWVAIMRVLKPGGHLVAFGAPRNYHRLAVAIEDAGFEIRDCLQWIFGSGFPKSLDISKAIDKAAGATREKVATGAPVKRMIPGADQNKEGWEKTNGRKYVPGIERAATADAAKWEGWGTALKPAYEPILLARKPLDGTNAENVLRHGVGGLNIDGCRVNAPDGVPKFNKRNEPAVSETLGNGLNGSNRTGEMDTLTGRWPANIIHDGSEEVLAAFPDAPGAFASVRGDEPSTSARYVFGGLAGRHAPREKIGDSGSAARFFYSAKADSDDRIGSKHPTVKPIDLMRWLVRLVTPPGGTILDPFAGTGTTGEAAFYEGFNAILIEREPEYQADIARRMKLILAGPDERQRAIHAEKAKGKPVDAGPLFAGQEALL